MRPAPLEEGGSAAGEHGAWQEIGVACEDATRALSEHSPRGSDIEFFQDGSPAVIEIPSPCVGVCRMDPATGLCAGCMRTLDEISAWPRASHGQRLQIVEQLRARRRAVGRTSAADSRPRRRHRLATS